MSTRDRTRLSTRPDTRDDDAADVIVGVLEEDPPAQLLVAGDRTGRVADRLSPLGVETHVWRRRARGKVDVQPWPEGRELAAATLRMPRAKTELVMALHALAGCVRSGGTITVFGANDEGIKSVGKRMKALLDDVETVDSRRHCRVWRGRVPEDRSNLRTEQSAWLETRRLVLPVGDEERELDLVSYPGTFAKGGVDPASAALLRALPAPPAGARVMDFACGIGVLARGIAERQPDIELQLVDSDALSTAAARANLAAAPEPARKAAKVATGDGWRAAPTYRRYDLIVSNPPIHTGKGRDYSVLTELVETAPRRLLPKGSLWIVVQRQVPLRDMLEANFDDVSVAWEDTRFRVWRCGRLEDRLDI